MSSLQASSHNSIVYRMALISEMFKGNYDKQLKVSKDKKSEKLLKYTQRASTKTTENNIK